MNALVSAASGSPIVPRLRLPSNASTRSFGSFSDSSADISSTNASADASDYSFEEESTSEGLLRLAKAASTISSMEFSFAASVSSPVMKTTHVVSDYYSSPESESSAASTPPPSFVHVGQSRTSSDGMPPSQYAGLGNIDGPSLQHYMYMERPRMLMASSASSSAIYDTPATYPPRFSNSYADIGSRSPPPNHHGHVATGGYPHPLRATPSYPTSSSASTALDSSALDSPHNIPAMNGPTSTIYGTPAVVVHGGGRSLPKKKRKYTKSGLYAKKSKPIAMPAKKPVVAIAADLALATKEVPKTKKDKKSAPAMAKKVKKSVAKNKGGKGGKSSGKTTKAKKSTMKKMKSSSSKSQLLSQKKKVVQISNTTSLTDTLFQMLSDPDVQHITSWQRHGHAFDIHDKDAFVDKVLPLYFPYSRSKVANAKYTTFTRKLNRYGFKLMNRGKLAGGYHHPLFHRDRPESAEGIACESKPKTSRRK